jgi:hypothetical protein
MPVIRVSYHAKDRLPLILGPLRQSHESLKARRPDAAVFLRSGWLRGPHLDLCVIADDPPPDLDVEIAAVRDWVQAHPSAADLNAEDYEQSSRQLGALEGVPGPYGPLRPDNNVSEARYRPPRLVQGHEALQAQYVEFFDSATPLIFDLAALKAQSKTAFTFALLAMLARTADRLKIDGQVRGVASLRAHAEFFFANYDASGRVRAHFDQLEPGWRPVLRELVLGTEPSEALDASDRARIEDIVRSWKVVLDATMASVRQASRQDSSWFYYNPSAFTDEKEQKYATSFAEAGIDAPIRPGATLDQLNKNFDSDLFTSEDFQVFRITLNMFYSILPVLSVSPAERFGMCDLVSATVRKWFEELMEQGRDLT